MKFWIHHSLMFDNSFQLLREDDTQIRIDIKGDMIIPSKKLTPDEANYIRKEIIEKRKKGFIA